MDPPIQTPYNLVNRGKATLVAEIDRQACAMASRQALGVITALTSYAVSRDTPKQVAVLLPVVVVANSSFSMLLRRSERMERLPTPADGVALRLNPVGPELAGASVVAHAEGLVARPLSFQLTSPAVVLQVGTAKPSITLDHDNPSTPLVRTVQFGRLEFRPMPSLLFSARK